MASASIDDPRRRILTLQAGRALAALAVVLFHVREGTQAFVGPIPDVVALALRHGDLGVDFFFVLSGFIITHINADLAPGRDWLRRYAGSRLSRIYIPYLPVGIGMALIYSFFPDLSAARERGWSWIGTLTLLPEVREPALNVAWTLCHEMAFYAIFAVAFLLRRPLLGVAAWAALILAAHILRLDIAGSLILRPINLEFLFGMLAAFALKRKAPGLAMAGLGGLFLAIFLLREGELTDDWVRLPFAAAIACLLVPLVRAEQRGRFTIPLSLLVLGEASYALYLVHNPLISAVMRLGLPNWWTAALAGLAVALAGGFTFHFLYERPAMRQFRKLRQAGRRETG